MRETAVAAEAWLEVRPTMQNLWQWHLWEGSEKLAYCAGPFATAEEAKAHWDRTSAAVLRLRDAEPLRLVDPEEDDDEEQRG